MPKRRYEIEGHVHYFVKGSVEAENEEDARQKFHELALSDVTIVDGDGIVADEVRRERS